MEYSDKILDEIKFRNDIVKIVSEDVTLQSKGKDLFGLCPFHKGKTPTFSVVPAKQIFYCFGCKKGGNVFNYIMQIKNIDFKEAIKYLAEKSNFNLDEVGMKEQNLTNQKNRVIQINNRSGRYFYTQLQSDRGAGVQKIFKENEITTQIIKKFGLGYSLKGWSNLYKFLVSQKFSDDDIELSGLVFKSSKGNLVDRFQNRIMFPLFGGRNILTGFCGLSLDESQAKYLYTPNTEIFKKQSSPFALNIANRSLSKKIVLFEEIFDVILANQYGVDWSVALPHYFINGNTANLLYNFNECIITINNYLALSSEILTKINSLKVNGCKIKILEIPNGKTMSAMICQKKDAIGDYIIDTSKPFLDYIIDNFIKHKEQNKSINDVFSIVSGIINILAKYGNESENELNALIYATKYKISYNSFICELENRKDKLRKIKNQNFNREFKY